MRNTVGRFKGCLETYSLGTKPAENYKDIGWSEGTKEIGGSHCVEDKLNHKAQYLSGIMSESNFISLNLRLL
jgi:hypothetical protein